MRKNDILRYAWEKTKKYKKQMLFGMLMAPVITIFSIISSYTLKVLVDDILPEKNIEKVWLIQMVFFGSVMAGAVLSILKCYIFSKVSEYAKRDLRKEYFMKYISADYKKRKNVQAEYILNTIDYKIEDLDGIFLHGYPLIIISIGDITLTLLIMFSIEWRLTLLSLPVFPLLIFANNYLKKLLAKEQGKYQLLHEYMDGDILEGVNLGDEIYIYHAFAYMEQKFMRTASKRAASGMKLSCIYEMMRQFSWALIMVPYQAILYGIGGTMMIKNGMPTIGILLIFANFTNHLIQPIMELIQSGNDIAVAKISIDGLEELDDILKSKESITKEKRSELPISDNRVISTSDMVYCYGEDNHLIRYKAFCVGRGDIVVLWGKNGCGKSTLLKILFGFLKIQDGEIVKNESIKWGFLQQNPKLFSVSIRENFRIVNPDITEEQMWDCLKMTEMDEVVRLKENGLNCMVSNTNTGFSGGEYRRLCLSVLLALKAEVMLLDEPTSELDAENAKIVADTISYLCKDAGKTIIIATHDQIMKERGTNCIDL